MILFNINLFDYNLPKNLIAQKQIKPRDHSRLLVLERQSQKIKHQHFYDLPDILNENDILVLNETKVFPARLLGQKKTGGRVEVFLIRKVKANIWQAMIGGRNLKSGDQIYFKHDFQVKLVKKVESKVWQIEFNKSGQESERLIEKIGQTPLPPYIKTQDSQQIRKDYQTIFAKNQGSIAAPTAGLHFTKRILQKLLRR